MELTFAQQAHPYIVMFGNVLILMVTIQITETERTLVDLISMILSNPDPDELIFELPIPLVLKQKSQLHLHYLKVNGIFVGLAYEATQVNPRLPILPSLVKALIQSANRIHWFWTMMIMFLTSLWKGLELWALLSTYHHYLLVVEADLVVILHPYKTCIDTVNTKNLN